MQASINPNSGDAAAARRRSFVAAATAAFFANGYAGTTMSSIASSVGGSKTTLWTYFPSKEHLFTAVLDDIVEQYGQARLIELPPDEKLETVLTNFANALLATILSEPVLNLYRLVVGEAQRFPHLAEIFYARAPGRGKARFAAYLEGAVARGDLRPGDSMLMARQFIALCHAGEYQSALLNLGDEAALHAIKADADIAVDAFLRIWRA